MPRIDSSNPEIAEILHKWNITYPEGFTLDVCWVCWKWHFQGVEDTQLEHPDYEDWADEDDPYTCAMCGVILDEKDD